MAEIKMAHLTLRRLRQSKEIRELTQEVRLSHLQMIQPLFVVEGISKRQPIAGLTGVFRETPESLIKQVESDLEAGVRKFLLFSVPTIKRAENFDFNFAVNQIQNLKNRFGKDLFLALDVCLCSFTTHGQCGILNEQADHVENGKTVQELARCATLYAQAGANCVAPSDMMDSRVAAIRASLNQADLDRTLIMSYSAKFNSRFYGPFRIAADSSPKGECSLKDRASYQIDSLRPGDALASSLRDAEEGADILMVKPGLPYLDVLATLSKEIKKPWAVYEVSGEYAALELLAREGLAHGPSAHIEAWSAFVRAGAAMIITYGARHARHWLKEFE